MKKTRLQPPESLTEPQVKEFRRLVGELDELANEIGPDAIAAYSVSFCRWRDAESEIAASGTVVKVAGRPQETPYLRISVVAARQMRNFQAEVERRRKQLAKVKAKSKATPPPMRIADDMEASG